MREDIHELTNDELADGIWEFAQVVADEMGAPRTAESLIEAAKRLRGKTNG